MVEGRRGRQDRGQQQHDRPRHEGAGTPPDRGPGGLQVVRRRAPRRVDRLRRRGERRRVVPAHRRHDLDHGQRRHRAGPARGGDHRHAWHRSGSTVPGAHPRVRDAGVRADRRARDGRSETAAATALRRGGRRERAGGRHHPLHHHDRARQRGIHRRAESDHGRGMVRRASVRHGGCRTSSTQRASATARISSGSRPRRRRSSPDSSRRYPHDTRLHQPAVPAAVRSSSFLRDRHVRVHHAAHG